MKMSLNLRTQPKTVTKTFGILNVPLINIQSPPENLRCRPLNENFVLDISREIEMKKTLLGYKPLTVMVADADDIDMTKLSTYTYYCVGGNHLRAALQRLHKNDKDRHIQAEVFMGLSEREAIRIGYEHNIRDKRIHDVTFIDQAEICRSELLKTARTIADDVQLITADSTWRRNCLQMMSLEHKRGALDNQLLVAGYSERCWNLELDLRGIHELTPRNPKPITQTLFSKMKGLSEVEKFVLLKKLVLDELTIPEALKECTHQRNLRTVRSAFLMLMKTHVKNWEEAVCKFPNYTRDEDIRPFAGKVSGMTMPKEFIKYCEEAKETLKSPRTSLLDIPELDIISGTKNKTMVGSEEGLRVIISSYSSLVAFLVYDDDDETDSVVHKTRNLMKDFPAMTFVVFGPIEGLATLYTIQQENGNKPELVYHYNPAVSITKGFTKDCVTTFIVVNQSQQPTGHVRSNMWHLEDSSQLKPVSAFLVQQVVKTYVSAARTLLVDLNVKSSLGSVSAQAEILRLDSFTLFSSCHDRQYLEKLSASRNDATCPQDLDTSGLRVSRDDTPVSAQQTVMDERFPTSQDESCPGVSSIADSSVYIQRSPQKRKFTPNRKIISSTPCSSSSKINKSSEHPSFEEDDSELAAVDFERHFSHKIRVPHKDLDCSQLELPTNHSTT